MKIVDIYDEKEIASSIYECLCDYVILEKKPLINYSNPRDYRKTIISLFGINRKDSLLNIENHLKTSRGCNQIVNLINQTLDSNIVLYNINKIIHSLPIDRTEAMTKQYIMDNLGNKDSETLNKLESYWNLYNNLYEQKSLVEFHKMILKEKTNDYEIQ